MSITSREDPARRRASRGPLARMAWLLLAVALCVGFVLLGNWQVRRLSWKRQLIHDVATRVQAAPVAAPGPAQWPAIDRGAEQYLHVRLHGRFIGEQQTLVHGSSSQGYGFWAMAPLRTDAGFIVMVNRGYIPAGLPGTPAYAQTRPSSGEVSVSGLLRFSDPGGGFLRPNRPAAGQWYSRDVAAIAAASRLPTSQVAPYFVDAEATAADTSDTTRWPQAGLTVIHFPNHHLSYLITWYLLALGVAAGTVYVTWEEWRRTRGKRPRA